MCLWSKDLYLSKWLSSLPTSDEWRGPDGCSLPAAYQIGRSTFSNISGNCWDLFINILRVVWILTLYWGRRSDPHFWDRLDRPHCTSVTFCDFFRWTWIEGGRCNLLIQFSAERGSCKKYYESCNCIIREKWQERNIFCICQKFALYL